jgi:hypothetical protein
MHPYLLEAVVKERMAERLREAALYRLSHQADRHRQRGRRLPPAATEKSTNVTRPFGQSGALRRREWLGGAGGFVPRED